LRVGLKLSGSILGPEFDRFPASEKKRNAQCFLSVANIKWGKKVFCLFLFFPYKCYSLNDRTQILITTTDTILFKWNISVSKNYFLKGVNTLIQTFNPLKAKLIAQI
jgi:hypothetical protein